MRSPRHDEQQPGSRGGVEQVPQHAQRGGVRPVQVVQDDHQRPGLGGVDDGPADRLPGREAVRQLRGLPTQVGRAGQAVQDRGPRPQRRGTIVLRATTHQHLGAATPGHPGQLRAQPGLADTGLTHQHRRLRRTLISPLEQAHELLQDTLLDFYDQVADGRLTLMPTDLRAYIYGMAQQRLAAAVPAQQPLPVAEASRRQRLLQLFNQLGADCQQVLTYFYFRGYNAQTVGGKMGFPNATVARRQKSACLRKLYELMIK